MDDDKTIINPNRYTDQFSDSVNNQLLSSVTLSIELIIDGKSISNYKFINSFTVGRANDNAIIIDSAVISRHHLEILFEENNWWIHNLKSVNGIYIEGQRIEQKSKLSFPVKIAIGLSGIYLNIKQLKKESEPVDNDQIIDIEIVDKNASSINNINTSSQEAFKAKLLAQEEADDAGDNTRFLRALIREDRVVRGKSYKKIIGFLASFFILSVCLVAYQQFALANTRQLAIDMFYDIKTLEVSLAEAKIRLDSSAESLAHTLQVLSSDKIVSVQQQLKAEQDKILAEKLRMQEESQRLANMKLKYRQYVKQINTFKLRFPTTEQYEAELIAKVARELGESELEVPEDFILEVKKYIHYWQASSRLQNAMDVFEKNNYLPIVTDELKKRGLPLYFIYLPLQESNYDSHAIGPETRFGIAKGAWQLLSTTAEDNGISAGSLVNSKEFDPQDERFDFTRSTQAGVKYLNRIYSTEAQASGLLVMASYNYGDTRVRNMISNMPNNPKDKNFWQLMQQYKLPDETHDYVFYIFSAAVIGEDPQHFGFNFKPPLMSQLTDSKN